MNQNDVSGTEWPLFGTVFYLWATEALQDAWNENQDRSGVMPREAARGAIDAAATILADPGQATWVRRYWGDNYLHEQDLFYRMLLIAGLTSYEKLSQQKTYHNLLQDQVQTLAAEIDASPNGLLDDYPTQCYPIDVLPAIAVIRRADSVLGTDHSAFVVRALRAFTEGRLDPATALPAYRADSKTGIGEGSARGVGLSFMLIWAPELWPETAEDWFRRYREYFWAGGSFLAGIREYPKGLSTKAFMIDVDAGPVVFGYGTAASAFGIGAARANGHFELAYPLSAEALICSWPLADGTLLGPRLLSNLAEAPYLGESAFLFNFTRKPLVAVKYDSKPGLPAIVYLGIAIYLGLGLLLIGLALDRVRQKKRDRTLENVPHSGLQFRIWLTLVGGGALAFSSKWNFLGIILVLCAQLLPTRFSRGQQ